MTIWVICVGEGMGDIPGVQGVLGGLQILRNFNLIDTRTQTLGLRSVNVQA